MDEVSSCVTRRGHCDQYLVYNGSCRMLVTFVATHEHFSSIYSPASAVGPILGIIFHLQHIKVKLPPRLSTTARSCESPCVPTLCTRRSGAVILTLRSRYFLIMGFQRTLERTLMGPTIKTHAQENSTLFQELDNWSSSLQPFNLLSCNQSCWIQYPSLFEIPVPSNFQFPLWSYHKHHHFE